MQQNIEEGAEKHWKGKNEWYQNEENNTETNKKNHYS